MSEPKITRRPKCGRDTSIRCWALDEHLRPYGAWTGLQLLVVVNRINARGTEGKGARFVERTVGVVARRADLKAKPKTTLLKVCPFCGAELHEQSPRAAFRRAIGKPEAM